MPLKRTHVVFPSELILQIDALVGKRARSAFLLQAAEAEVLRLKQMSALKTAAGAWKDKDHPEFAQGTAAWVRKLRRESDRTLKKSPPR